MINGLVMVVGLVLIVMIHETGHFVAAKAFDMKATQYFLGFGPRLWSFRRGETEYGVKALPLGGYVKIIGMSALEDVDPEEEHRTYRGKPFWQKTIVVMAGIASHFVIAYVLLYVADVVVGQPDLDVARPVVAEVVLEMEDGVATPAAAVGLQPGDRFEAAAGERVTSWDQFTEILRSRPDQEVPISVERDGQLITVIPTLTSLEDPETGEVRGFLGVRPEFARDRANPITALGTTATDVGSLTWQSVRGIGSFVTGFGDFLNSVFTEEEIADDQRPISVVGVVRLGADDAFGMDFVLTLLAFFSIFVGVLNAIPLYPFDGGHFMVALWEKVTGRAPDVTKLVPVSAAILLFFVVLSLLALYFDIVDPIDLG